MWRTLALALILMSSLFVASAHSQTPPTQPGIAAPNTPTAPPLPNPDGDRPAAPMVWGVAILCTLVILFIVCMPSRKG